MNETITYGLLYLCITQCSYNGLSIVHVYSFKMLVIYLMCMCMRVYVCARCVFRTQKGQRGLQIPENGVVEVVRGI